MTYHFVVPCAAKKADQATAARELYLTDNFALFLDAAEAEAEATARDLGADVKVWILSAKHGLLDPDQVVAPYDVTMGDAEAVTVDQLAAQAVVRGLAYGDEVYAMLPKAYRELLAAALAQLDVTVADMFEAAVRGIGDQRGVACKVTRLAGEAL